MSVTTKTPYDAIPYDVLALPDKGPLPAGATRKEIDARYTLVARGGMTPEKRAAWDTLRDPGKRIGWDLFCSAADRGQDALRKLVDEAPVFTRAVIDCRPADVLPDLIDWSSAPAQPPRMGSAALRLASNYDRPVAALLAWDAAEGDVL